ncbi:L-threonylcarbamoyladenylate synthase [Kamptonema cortianum]|nr:L-threonylcarbamoyladenylate synthase [Kamptonema cortianum]
MRRRSTKFFSIKGRPEENPLIVHIAEIDQVHEVASEFPALARRLAEKYWPGPLTLVLPKKPEIPMRTSGGLNTIAVRMPRHPVALEVIRQARCPIAAPSANAFMGLSPTDARHIDPEILVDVEVILDGGPCEIGLESTVVDMTGDVPRILRPGAISRAEIQAMAGMPLGHAPPTNVKASPGMYRRHYAPKTPVVLVSELTANDAGLTFGDPANPNQTRMPRDPMAYGATIYAALKQLDSLNLNRICVQEPPDDPAWEAVLDRLRKASANLA